MHDLTPEFTPALLHQLREQLSQMTGVSQLLAPLVTERGEIQHSQYLSILNQSIYRTLRLVRNAEFALEPPSAEDLRPVVLDLAGLCREVWRECEGLLADELEITFDYTENASSALIQGDDELLQRMILNLVANAAQAAGRGGRLSLRLTAQRSRVRLTLSNSGGGTLPGPGGKDDRLLPGGGALGLGVPIARRIAALHGGALVFQRREGHGISATAAFPIAGRNNLPLRGSETRQDLAGGFSTVLLELSPLLGSSAFSPGELNG